jgi:type IX secretion system PorP/SprF family membrane protein
MKKIIIALALIACISKTYAQQDPQYTMYMWNQLAANPAYAGSRECLSSTLHYRTQWVGVKGAPKTISFGIHSPLKNERVSLGLQIVNDKLGVSNMTNVAACYAYRIPVSPKAKLAIGLQALISNFNDRFLSTSPTQSGDGLLSSNVNKTFPNFGAGLYYNTDKAYVGLSVPHLINNKLSEGTNGLITADQARQYRHLFLMGGYLHTVSDAFKIKPSFVLKYAPNSPWETDLNVSALLYEALWLGVTWRSDFSNQKTKATESIDLMAIYEITSNMRAGIAYDITATKLGSFNKGTYEFLLGYDFNHNRGQLLTPRYF